MSWEVEQRMEQLPRTPGTTQIAQNAEMTVEDFNYIPFNQEGGCLQKIAPAFSAYQPSIVIKARELFGKDLDKLIQELNGYLIA